MLASRRRISPFRFELPQLVAGVLSWGGRGLDQQETSAVFVHGAFDRLEKYRPGTATVAIGQHPDHGQVPGPVRANYRLGAGRACHRAGRAGDDPDRAAGRRGSGSSEQGANRSGVGRIPQTGDDGDGYCGVNIISLPLAQHDVIAWAHGVSLSVGTDRRTPSWNRPDQWARTIRWCWLKGSLADELFAPHPESSARERPVTVRPRRATMAQPRRLAWRVGGP